MARIRRMQDDFDGAWKNMLSERRFASFVAFFMPDAFLRIDWTRPVEFLEQELRAITRKSKRGNRAVDRLVKVWLNGQRPPPKGGGLGDSELLAQALTRHPYVPHLVTTLLAGNICDGKLHTIGVLDETAEDQLHGEAYLTSLQWLPDNRHLSFDYRDAIWLTSVD